VLAGVEADEMTSRDVRTTAPAGKLPFPGEDVALEADELSAAGTDDPVLAVDDAASLRRVEYLACHRGVGGERLEAVERLRERQLGVLEVGEQLDAEFDGLRDRILAGSRFAVPVDGHA